jgi:hypothetical protein
MTFVSQGANPASRSTSWADALSPLAQAAGKYAGQHRNKQNEIAQSKILEEILKSAHTPSSPGMPVDPYQVIQALAGGNSQGLPQSMTHPHQQAAYKQLEQQQAVQNRAAEQQQGHQNKLEEIAASIASHGKPNVEAQKWAYGELQKEKLLDKADDAVAKIVELSKKNVTGPNAGLSDRLAGLYPKIAKDKAIRDEIDALSLSVIGTHANLFKTGSFTDREFNFIKDKVLSSKMTPESLREVGKQYQDMNALARKYIDATKEAVRQYGFIPELPFIADQISKSYGEKADEITARLAKATGADKEIAKERKESPAATQKLGGEGAGIPGSPEVLGRSQGEKPQFKKGTTHLRLKHKNRGEATVPVEEYRPHPDVEVVEELANQ